MMGTDNFFIIAREPGAQNPAIPTWAGKIDNAFGLDRAIGPEQVQRLDIQQVPGAYQLLNVLSESECEDMIRLTESLGYLKDAAVSLPRDIRHNDNITVVVDDATERLLWQRVENVVNQHLEIFDHKKPLGLNTRFRFYRYSIGDYFHFHSDGDWPGSRVDGDRLITNAYEDRYSKMTFLILLNDDFTGGATRFRVNANNTQSPAKRGEPALDVDIRTPKGGVLLFPHGHHPLHCVHASVPITQGVKYIIRTDLLFEL